MQTSRSECIGQTFTAYDLRQGALTHKRFDECLFDHCDFSEAELKHCHFVDCEFRGCNLRTAKVSFSMFNSVKFIDCKVIGVDWTQATWSALSVAYPLHFERCILSNASFFGLTLQDAVFRECKIHDVDFGEANCESADFSYSDLQSTSFHRTNLRSANFKEAINYNIDVLNCNIKHAKFSLPAAILLLNSLDIELI